MTCLDDDTLAEWLDGDVAPARRAALLAHLDGCAACRRLVAELGASTEPADGEPEGDGARLGRGDRIGRLVIERVIGAGAMGVVYAAADAELGRTVAVKLMRPEHRHGDAAAARVAMSREARTLARLSHPNVITIHDVDVHAGQVCLVMELVDGWTLREWLEAPRAWPEIRDVLVQAGRGIAAAHAAGVIHRDVKPDNVLVGRDGRVRVTDFGLARTPGEGGVPAAGTPAYMAPELRAGGVVDASADRYAFCVMAHEAIYGARPGASPPASADGPRGVSARARKVVARGLAPAIAARPASMGEIVAALDHRPALTPARVAIGGGALATLAAAAALAWPTPRTPAPCTGGVAAWGTPWAGAPPAGVARQLADYRDRWVGVHRAACLAHHRGEESDQLLDQRMACLRARRDEVIAVAEIVGSDDPAVAGRGAQIVAALSSPGACGGRAVAEVAPRPDAPAARAAVEQVGAQLAAVRAEIDAARWGRCHQLADAALPAARATGYLPLIGLALFDRAFCTDDAAAAMADLDEALLAAERGHDDLLRVRVMTRFEHLIGFREHRWAEALRWQDRARAALDRAGGDDELEYIWAVNSFEIAAGRADLAAEAALFERMTAAADRLGGPGSWRHAVIAGVRGNALADRGLFAEALPHHLRSIELSEALYGPDTVASFDAHANVAFDLIGLDRAAEALPRFAHLDALQAIVDPGGDDSWIRTTHAAALRGVGDVAAALVEDRRGKVGCARFSGPDSRGCAEAWLGEGLDLLALGDAGALPALERAVALFAGDVPSAAQFALARALPAAARARARGLATAALAQAEALVARGGSARERDEIRAWLARP